MANPQTKSYNGKLSGNILGLGSSVSGNMTLVQEMAFNSMFEKVEGAHRISAVKLYKKREAEIDSCFEPKIEFYYSESENELKKTFDDLENLYREKLKKKSVVPGTEGSGKGEYIERDNLIVLDDATGLPDKSYSFVRFLTYCHKFGYSVFYIFQEPTLSSPRWKDILSQMQIFYIFLSAMDLVLNHLVKFITRGTNTTGYMSRQQLWLSNLVRTIKKQSGYSCFCLNK